MNPFKSLDCYNDAWQDAFHSLGNIGAIHTAWRTLGPHCFCTIESAYQAMKRTNRNQAVVICGESGAGKTWTAKLMLDYLLDMDVSTWRRESKILDTQLDLGLIEQMNNEQMARRERAGSKMEEEMSNKEMLSSCNVVLEAFGNAKTQRNDNSSRFGKFSSIFFSQNYQVEGCNFDHYLLERSRVIIVPQNERNYHILHYLAKDEQVKNGATFKYLGNAMNTQRASEVEVNGKKSREFDDVADFKVLKENMSQACFPEDVQSCMYDVFLGLLYLGNCTFDGEDTSKLSPSCKADFEKACQLMGMKTDEMEKALTHRTSPTIVKEPIPLSAEKADTQKDNVAKTIYSRLFDWIVAQMNTAMLGVKNQYDKDDTGTVGLLDIFGFEDMDINGFEQMFINLTNERIQHHFNNIMFAAEMRLYDSEGIVVEFEKPDNSPCVKLFTSNEASNVGLIRVLQECVKNQLSSDGKDMKKLLDNRLKNHKDWVPIDSKDFKNDAAFKVRHYAGVITYQCQNFIEKSQDSVDQYVVEKLSESSKMCPANPKTQALEPRNFFQELFANDLREIEEKKARNSTENSTVTVGVTFRQQLANLMDNKLGAYDTTFGGKAPDTDPHVDSVFVRCIKPKANSLATFDQAMVRSQLISGGVISALKIRELGMPDRMDCEEFVNEFWPLEHHEKSMNEKSPAERVKGILDQFVEEMGPEGPRYKLGKTKIFMKSGILIRLREMCDVIIRRCAKVVQYKWRAKTGLDLLTELTQLKGRLESCQAEAKREDVWQVAAVQKEWNKAQTIIEGLYSNLKMDPKTWEKTESALQKVSNKEKLRRGTEVAISDRLGHVGAVVKEDIKEAKGAIEATEREAEIVLTRRRNARERVEQMGLGKIAQVNLLQDRLDEVLRYCSASDPPERGGNLFKRCTQEKETLARIVNEEIPKAEKEVVSAVDITIDNPPLALPGKVDQVIADGTKMVESTEKAAEELIVARKKFEFEEMQATPELQALTKDRENASERLDIIQQDIEQAKTLNFSQVTDAYSEVMRCDAAVDEILREALDGKKYVAALQQFLEAEKSVQQWVETMKRLEAEKAERERKARRKLFDSHKHSKELLQVYHSYVDHLFQFQEHLDSTAEFIPVDGLSGTKASIEEYSSKVTKLMEQLDLLNVEAMVDDTAGEKIRFHFKGKWSAECFKLLGAELIPTFEFAAPMLDKERFLNVLDAVEALNSGIMAIEGSHCIGYSNTWKQYYLLFQTDKEKEALAFMEGRQLQHAKDLRSKQKKTISKAVGGAIGVLSQLDLDEDVKRTQEALEMKIKDQMRGDLEQAYLDQAAAQVAANEAAAQSEADAKVKTAKQNLKQVLHTGQERENVFKDKVAKLSQELAKVKVDHGIQGLVPAMHKQLVDCGGCCHGLLEQLRSCFQLATKLVEDVEECLAYMDALQNNPKTLPGLRDYVDVLTRSHTSHNEAEKLCRDLGLDGQLAALEEVRAPMSEVDVKLRAILEGKIVAGSGQLMQELDLMRYNLQVATKSFELLRRVFGSWTDRLLKAAQFIEQALECVDLSVEHVENLQENVRLPHETGLWKHITRRVVENFCVSDRTESAQPMNLHLEGQGPVPKEVKEASQIAQQQELMTKGSPFARQKKKQEEADAARPWKQPTVFSQKRKAAKINIDVGDFVQDIATETQRGIVHFIGGTSFAAGDWVGIELEGPTGRNDGSVAGIRYFTCPPNHGIFLRPSAVGKVPNGHPQMASAAAPGVYE
eukprot:CAMPEP_0206422788 /NCGR_PEP_ID=MMETSP0324_2-20121206/2299_1 /ASSEMBLY_ACC=CAM_ASM_000836 /TAXON_ID=2866 /ORGANISM="Crypthecodinium cohnii, Strain Seligo" /LENGTH=1743 /DNA_ID=CAMNT_0053887235 /DNA_START=13 /DNA_END=5244 /DNA_ORIENTATION=-